MRIVSGKYRGKKLKEFNLDSTKPTLDRVKESIFNLIQFDIVDSAVLDLFSGTGALGVEAVSRDAKIVHFVDVNKLAVSIIKENLQNIKGNYQVFNMDFKQYLNQTNLKFDIIFLDPPYKTTLGLEAINFIMQKKLLNNNGIIIFETSADNDFDLNYPDFDIIKKKYGTVVVYKMVLKD